MSRTSLALFGGKKVRTTPFTLRKTILENDIQSALEVFRTGDLSLFYGSPGEYFMGGPKIQEFEKRWATKYGFKHAISVNSWTTGLMACVGAAGIEPGDEVICTPYSMSATATSILFYGGIPVFVDIEPETFNIDPRLIEQKITPRTKAIMLVHLFGHPADMDSIIKIAKKYNLKIIEDAAHAPGAKYKGQYVGACADIGGFSFNYHKHIHTGEGGLIVTNNDEMALRCQLIRNHGENLIESYKLTDLSNVMGSNYRMTEVQAAIGSVQMERLEDFLNHRNKLALHLSSRLSDFDCFTPPVIKPDCTHSFYCYSIKYDEIKTGVPRDVLCNAIRAELPEPKHSEQEILVEGYVRPLYLNPIYQKQIAIGKKGFPWSMNPSIKYDYQKGLCPVTERMHEKELIYFPIVREAVTLEDIDDVIKAITKVMSEIESLKSK